MFDFIPIRKAQGYQAIPDVKAAKVNPQFRGLPVLHNNLCEKGCQRCKEICPTQAIETEPLSVDIGKCIFCGDCTRECTSNALSFNSFHHLAASNPDFLKIKEGMDEKKYEENSIPVRKEILRVFGKSLKFRQVSAGGCNACELELNACSNVNFDMQRFGIEFVASPRHADGIVITGPVSGNMAEALLETYAAVPDPKLVILAGTCAISGGVFKESPALKREVLKNLKIDLYIPGCPVHPLTFLNGILNLISGKK